MTQSRKEIETARVKHQLSQTAAEVYAERQADIGVLLDLLKEHLAFHAELAGRNPRSWGPAGDLAFVSQELKDLLVFVMSAKKAQRERDAIEEHLAEMREKRAGANQ